MQDICFERRPEVFVSVTSLKTQGFGYECTVCHRIFNRLDNHSCRCVGNKYLLRNKATRTFTEEKFHEKS